MIQTLSSGLLPTSVTVPPSKSYANRALILGALKGNMLLENVPEASDVTFLIQALQAVGVEISQKENVIKITSGFPACEKVHGAQISVGEGGTTARFLACLLVMGKAPYTLVLGERLKQRPWQSFIELVQRHGGRASLQNDKLHLQGPLKIHDSLDVDASLTTQFASGFQLALAWSSIKVNPINLKSSLSYWQMTEWLVTEMSHHSQFIIPSDWSSAGYPMAFAALNQTIHFPGLKIDPLQADVKICSVLEKIGSLEIKSDGISVRKWQPRILDLNIDIHDCLDLFPTLAYLTSHIDGHHTFTGVSNLVHKESDRLGEVIKLLTRFGIQTHSKGESLVIVGQSDLNLPPQRLKFPDDHRLIMSGALFLRQHQGGEIDPAQAVHKSYPNFWQLFH